MQEQDIYDEAEIFITDQSSFVKSIDEEATVSTMLIPQFNKVVEITKSNSDELIQKSTTDNSKSLHVNTL